ncbi:MAG: alpha-amylase/4-alpha-glucanotransferase domain-containing protein [Bacteroidota bacterium]
MKKTITLALGFHSHQPVGNFDHVFEKSYERAYGPFLDLIVQHPKVKFAIHNSGPLLEWIHDHHPEYFTQLRAVVQTGQVEIMTGAFYEAILPIIPDVDKLGQIQKMSKYVKSHFGYEPTGMWLAERVWEQHITKPIADAGVRYVIVDDTHFKYAGLQQDQLFGYYVTEEEGESVNVFPISRMLRYMIPFQPVEKTIEYLRSVATEDGKRVVVYADDGEKFGSWPHTYEQVYERGWLKEFLQALEENSDWIRILHFSETIKAIEPAGRVYLPDAAYPEMLQWALPAKAFVEFGEFENFLKNEGMPSRYEVFVKAGFWRNFLVKYPESNNMHKKMLRVSRKAQEAKARGKKVEKTLDRVWAAQCNDAYWHGVFGGLYLPNLRFAIYRNLLEAEKELEKVAQQHGFRHEFTDFDRDGKEEVLVESPHLNVYFKPDLGGSIFELDVKKISYNLIDVVARREEGYHHKLKALRGHQSQPGAIGSIHDIMRSKEGNLDQHLQYDWYRRHALLDHFFGPRTTFDDFTQCTYPELGDFVDQPYACRVTSRNGNLQVQLWRDGALWFGSSKHRLRVTKTVTLKRGSLDLHVGYRVENQEPKPLDIWFGVEFVCGLLAGDAEDRYYVSNSRRLEDGTLRSRGIIEGAHDISLVDEWMGVEVQLVPQCCNAIWRFPVETVSLSESGFERIYQGAVVVPNWKVHLEKVWSTEIEYRIRLHRSER